MFDTFLQHLMRGGAYGYYHVLPERRSYWFPVNAPLAVDYAAVTSNLYFGVHPSASIPPCNAHGEVRPPHAVRSQLRTIAAINCLYAEYDEKDYGSHAAIVAHLDALTVPEPSALIHSGGGMHAYWLLREPYLLDTDDRLQAAKIIQARWVGVVGGDGGAHDLCRVLRVPGSHNYKYDPPRLVAWLACDLGRTYALPTLTAHLPPVVEPTPRAAIAPPIGAQQPIAVFNERNNIEDLLVARGYTRHGRHKMLSPYSSTGQAGVTIDIDRNRAYVHHGSDPLHDGYWKRPFDVVRILDCDGDFKRALRRIREAQS